MVCNVLITNPEEVSDLKDNLAAAIGKYNSGNDKDLIDFYKSLGEFKNVVRRSIPNDADRAKNLRNSKKCIIAELASVLDDTEGDYADYNMIVRGNRSLREKILNRITRSLNFFDDTQKSSNGDGSGDLKIESVKRDKRGRTFNNRIADLFGEEYKSSISKVFKEKFGDLFASYTMHDKLRNKVYSMDNETLNEQIWRCQAQIFENFVHYMKRILPDNEEIMSLSDRMFDVAKEFNEEEFEIISYKSPEELEYFEMKDAFNRGNFIDALDLYYKYVVKENVAEFRRKVVTQNSESRYRIGEETESKMFYSIADYLEKNGGEDYIKYLGEHNITKGDVSHVKEKAFEGTRMSREAMLVRDYLLSEKGKDLPDKIFKERNINTQDFFIKLSESVSDDFFGAATDYVFLNNFDDLIELTNGDLVGIDPATRGLSSFIKDKYSYVSIKSGSKKNYVGVDTYDAMEYTSDYIKSFLNTFELYDRRTGKSLRSRLSPQNVVVAFGKLKAGFVQGRYTTGLTSKEQERFMNALYGFVNDPVGNAKVIFDMFFKASGVGSFRNPISRTMSEKGQNHDRLTKTDWNVLYTLYHSIYDSDSSSSLWSIMKSENKLGDTNSHLISRAQKLIGDISSYLLRNNEQRYMQNSISGKGEVSNKVAKGWIDAYMTNTEREAINSYTNYMSSQRRTELQTKYGFELTHLDRYNSKNEPVGSDSHYVVTLRNGDKIDITVDDTRNNYGIMVGDENSNNITVRFKITDKNGTDVTEAYWSDMNKADLASMAEAYIFGKDDLTGEVSDQRLSSGLKEDVGKSNIRMRAALEFIDDFLGTNILSDPLHGFEVLENYSNTYSQPGGKGGLKNFMMPLLKMAMRGAYANTKYREANSSSMDLASYLSTSKDSLWDSYWYFKDVEGNYPRIGLDYLYDSCTYNVASTTDSAIDDWAAARAYVRGDNNTSTIKSGNGKYPKTSVNRLVQDIRKNIMKARDEYDENYNGRTTKNLLFTNMKGLGEQVQMLDTTVFGVTKDFADMSRQEMYEQAVFTDFYGALKNSANASYYSLTCAYGDKKAIFKNQIKLNEITDYIQKFTTDPENAKLHTVSKFYDVNRDDLLYGYKHSIGEYYKSLFSEVSSKQERIVRKFIADNESSADAKGERANNAKKALGDIDNAAKEVEEGGEKLYNAMKCLTEEDFVDAAESLGEEVVKEVDYRTVKKGRRNVLVPNELLSYYKSKYNDVIDENSVFRQEMLVNQKAFVENILSENLTFQIVREKYMPYYTGEETPPEKFKERSNQKLEAIKFFVSNFGKTFAKEGRNEMTQEQYFKKWVDSKGRLIIAKQGKNDIVFNSQYDHYSDEKFVLNPMLELYYLTDSLVARNLSVFTNGTEIENPLKGGYELDLVKRMDLDGFSHMDYARGYSEDMLITALDDLKATDGIDELSRKTNRLRQSGDGRYKLYKTVLDMSLANSMRQMQDTNNKRGSLAISTMHNAQLNMLDGVLNNVKVAVMENVDAAAWNYNSESKGNVDPREGSAYITPMQKRFENASFGDHMTPGEVSKNVFVSFKSGYGNQFILKMASQELSNRFMLLTDKPGKGEKINGLELFKKMTNEQVLEENDMVIGLNNKRKINLFGWDDQWFMKKVLFNDNWLYYKGKNGERRRIVELDATYSENNGKYIYYTLEGDGTKAYEDYSQLEHEDFALKDAEDYNEKVYHVFYDRTNPDGTVDRSVHLTSKSLDGAKKLLNEHMNENAHSINSVYELHTALGGMYCVDGHGNQSEANLDVVTNFCNYMGKFYKDENGHEIAIREAEEDYKYDQNTFRQPLKESLVAYVAPKSTAKKMVANINPRSSWYDKTKLHTMLVSADGLGVQMNAGKEVSEEQVRESTQMISILSNGYDHNATDAVLKAIGRNMLEKSGKLLELTQEFVKGFEKDQERTKAADELAIMIGNIVMKNSKTKAYETLTDTILDNVSMYMYKHSIKNSEEGIGFPISSPELYKEVMGTLSNYFTNNVLKREFPGAGFILVPSKDTVKYFEVRMRNEDGSYGEVEKLEPGDVLERARKAYHSDLMNYLTDSKRRKAGFNIIEIKDAEGNVTGHQLAVEVNAANERLYDVNLDLRFEDMSIADLEKIALEYNNKGEFSKYYTKEQDTYDFTKHLMDTWLSENTKNAQTFDNKDWFMPSDVVDVIDAAGNLVETISLDSMEKYITFKKLGVSPTTSKQFDSSYKFRENVDMSRDLRPSTIRWQIKTTDANGNVVMKWMNYFDLPHVEEIVLNGGNPRTNEYKLKCKAVLKKLFEGKVDLKNEKGETVEYDVYNLEQGSAEAIIGNMYAELFGINPGDSLAKVKSMGLEYFLTNTANTLKAPVANDYDLAFIKTNGDHVLLKFGELREGTVASERDFDNKDQQTKSNGEIVYTHGQKELFTIARWNEIFDDSVYYDNVRKRFYSKDSGAELDQKIYRRRKNGVIEKRFDLVKKYERSLDVFNSKGEKSIKKIIMYSIADQSVYDDAYREKGKNPGETVVKDWVRTKIQETAKKIYRMSDFETAEACAGKLDYTTTERKNIAKTLYEISDDVRVDGKKYNLLDIQRRIFNPEQDEETATWKEYDAAKEDYMKHLAQKRYVSFNESLKIIAGRIPATGMQSFMTMNVIGWTGKTNNEAYVSHFQIYLQGSDFDIDKANIMGQSFNSSGLYVGWSPYFDYTSSATLEASKALPLQESNLNIKEAGAKLEQDAKKENDPEKKAKLLNSASMERDNAADITNQLLTMILNSKVVNYENRYRKIRNDSDKKKVEYELISTLSADGMSESQKVAFLKALGEAYTEIVRHGGLYKYNSERIGDSPVSAAINALIEHNSYSLPQELSDEAIKNSIASTIWTISSDLRNAVDSSTPISTERFEAAAKKTPKYMNANALLPDNVFEKYYSTVDAVSAKDVVAIGANSSKAWDAILQAYNMTYESGVSDKIRRTFFKYNSKMIEGRSEGVENVREKVVRSIPDLDLNNKKISDAFEKVFGRGKFKMTVADVKNALSELINSATDNPKLLILDKLNCTPDYAGVYAACIMMGFSIEDTAAFMTSPYAELAVSYTGDSVFRRQKFGGSRKAAMNAAKGRLNSNSFLRGVRNTYLPADAMADIAEEIAENPALEKEFNKKKTLFFKQKFIDALNEKENSSVKEKVIEYLLPIMEKDGNLPKEYIKQNEKENSTPKFELSDENVKSLDDLMQAFIYASASSPFLKSKDLLQLSDILKVEFKDENDNAYGDYIETVDNIIYNIRKAVENYTGKKTSSLLNSDYKNGIEMFIKDAEEMSKLDEVTNELTTMTTAYLKFNQGMPWGDSEMYSQMNNMNRVITDRESAFKIKKSDLFKLDSKGEIVYGTDAEGKKVASVNEENMSALIKKIKDNNDVLIVNENDERFQRIENQKQRKKAVSRAQEMIDQRIRKVLVNAAEMHIMSEFDITKLLGSKEYRQASIEYLDLIKAFVNTLDVVYSLPHYSKMLDFFNVYYEVRNLTAKGRLLNKIYDEFRNDRVMKKDNIDNIQSYIDETMALEYLKRKGDIFLSTDIEGFNKVFQNANVSTINLSTDNGAASFKKFVEERLFDELKAKYPENGLVKNLERTRINKLQHLKAAIDMTNPYSTDWTRGIFEDLVKGLAQFQDVKFEYNESMSVADVFFLYDLIENKGQAGRNSLKNAFKELDMRKGEINKYYRTLSELDSDLSYVPDFNKTDLLIRTAPVVNEASESYRTEEFIKSKDINNNIKIKIYDNNLGKYDYYSPNEVISHSTADSRIRNKRLQNYMMYCPYLHPETAKGKIVSDVLMAEKTDVNEVKSLILDKSVSGKMQMVLIC